MLKHDASGIRTDKLTDDELRLMREDLLRVYCNLGSIVGMPAKCDDGGSLRRTRDDAMKTIRKYVFKR